MKETDYSIIQATVQQILSAYPYEIKEVLNYEQLTAIVANIYLNYDTAKAVTNHVRESVTIIASKQKIALIWDGVATHVKDPTPIVGYEDLTTDINNIIELINICYIKLLDI